jgi:hypothetical protein
MGHRHPGQGRRSHGGRHARDDLEGHTCDREGDGFLAAAAQHEGIAALEAHDASTAARRADHELVDRLLAHAASPTSLADGEALGAGGEAQHLGADQGVVEHEVGLLEATGGLPRE